MLAENEFYLSGIHDFVQEHNLEESSDLDVADAEGPIDLLYRDPAGTPVLGFRHLASDVYALTYIDPSLEDPWVQEVY